MKFMSLEIPDNLPNWISLKQGHNCCICRINWQDEELLEALAGEYDLPMSINELLQQLGFVSIGWIPVRLKAKDGCYLEGLNSIFSNGNGIPLKSPIPCFLNQSPCFAIDFSHLSKKKKYQILEVYKDKAVPLVYLALLSVKDLAVIPYELVEEITA